MKTIIAPPELTDMCFEMRDNGFVPYTVMTIEGRETEVISMPFPNLSSIAVMLREPGEPCTMREFRLWEAI